MPSTSRTYDTGRSTRSTRSGHSGDSQESHSTAPTSLYSSSPAHSIHTAYTKQEYKTSPATTFYPRSSTETYSSTVDSFQELSEEPDTYEPAYQIPEHRAVVDDDIPATTPSDFASYFPSTRRLNIRHDDTTSDGNWNLRVDTEDKRAGPIQLFHLKMNDIQKREFSLRRYERASGREVCHSCRKTKPAVEKRPTATFTRSMSTAFASMKPEFKRANSGLSSHSTKSKKTSRRQDSGYGSDDDDIPSFEEFMNKEKTVQVPTNITKLEFSNYAQVEVKRRGAKSTKRYEFEYWGHNYVWKRITKKDGASKEVSYHLYKDEYGSAVAHIVPELRSPTQVRDEARNGGWVPPCSLWISDKSVVEALTDVADVIVATGLIALVDDCIKRHFHSRQHKSHQVSVPGTQMNMEFVNPRTMVKQMFKRRDSGGSAKSESSQKNSPLRFQSPISTF